MIEAFYEHDGGDTYVASPFTRGPWDPGAQHGGPPSALLARVLTDADPVEGQQLARVTFEILRPVPIGKLEVKARVDRPGRKVSMVSAAISDQDGTEVMIARGWRLQPTPADVKSTDSSYKQPPPSAGEVKPWWEGLGHEPGFPTGVDVSFLTGGFAEIGPAVGWFRLRIPLVAGTEWRPTDPLFAAADCGNGISAAIDYRTHVFINPDLNVTINRLPRGEWVCLDAATQVEPGGITSASSILSDEEGVVGRAVQTLFVSAR